MAASLTVWENLSLVDRGPMPSKKVLQLLKLTDKERMMKVAEDLTHKKTIQAYLCEVTEPTGPVEGGLSLVDPEPYL